MRNPHDIIIKPVITERSTMDSMEGKYTFAVDRKATKTEVDKLLSSCLMFVF